MDIYLSVNNRAEVLRLPVLPPEFTVSKGRNNEVFETVSQGQLNLIGTQALKKISWSSFFRAVTILSCVTGAIPLSVTYIP